VSACLTVACHQGDFSALRPACEFDTAASSTLTGTRAAGCATHVSLWNLPSRIDRGSCIAGTSFLIRGGMMEAGSRVAWLKRVSMFDGGVPSGRFLCVETGVPVRHCGEQYSNGHACCWLCNTCKPVEPAQSLIEVLVSQAQAF